MKLPTKASSFVVALLALAVGISSCGDGDAAGRILMVDAEGAVLGLVYLDHNGDQVRDAADGAVADLEIRVFVAGTRIDEQRILYRGIMAGLTCGGQVHHVARRISMINVMGVQVKVAYTVVDITMTTGTVTTTETAASCWYQAPIFGPRIRMTGTTGVMDQVVIRINKFKVISGGVMAGIAVAGSRKRHVTLKNVININAVARSINMTGLAVAAR